MPKMRILILIAKQKKWTYIYGYKYRAFKIFKVLAEF